MKSSKNRKTNNEISNSDGLFCSCTGNIVLLLNSEDIFPHINTQEKNNNSIMNILIVDCVNYYSHYYAVYVYILQLVVSQLQELSVSI